MIDSVPEVMCIDVIQIRARHALVVKTKNVGPAALSVYMHDCMLFRINCMVGRCGL